MNIYKRIGSNYYILCCVVTLLFLTSCVTFISQNDYQEKPHMIVSKGDVILQRFENNSPEGGSSSLREFIFAKGTSNEIRVKSKLYLNGNKEKSPDSVSLLTLNINEDFTFFLGEIKFLIYELKNEKMIFSILK